MKSTNQKQVITSTIAILLLSLAVFLTYKLNCPNSSQFYAIRILFSIACGLLSILLVGQFQMHLRCNPLTLYATSSIGITALFYLVSPSLIEKFTSCTDPFSITIYTHGNKGKQDVVLRSIGEIVVDIKNDRKTEKINEKGYSIVVGIPSNYIGERVPINVLAPTYQSAYSDSLFELKPNQSIYIKLKRKNLDKIKGYVVNELNGEPIKNVEIKVGTLTPTFTDSYGYFEQGIPETEQEEKINIVIRKENFKTISDPITLNSNQVMKFPLTPITKNR
jgi:hypothetical protein